MTIIGTVDFRDFDLGCFLTLGGEVITYVIDGSTRAQYVVNVPGIDSELDRYQGKVPLFFMTPEDPYQGYILPSIVFRRSDATPAFDRQPWYGIAARAPAPDAVPVMDRTGKVRGYSKYVNQLRANPYDFAYDCEIKARRAQELNVLKKFVMKKFLPPWFIFKVIDSLGEVREYDAGEVSASNSSELADIADRTMSYTMSFTVRGEVDLIDDVTMPAVTGVAVGMKTKRS